MKFTKIPLSGRAAPGPDGEAKDLHRLPSRNKGPTSKRREGREGEKEERKRKARKAGREWLKGRGKQEKGKGRGREGKGRREESEGRGWCSPTHNLTCLHDVAVCLHSFLTTYVLIM